MITNDALYFPGEARNAQEVAIEICKSVDFHLLDHQSSAGAFFLLFPLHVSIPIVCSRQQGSKMVGSDDEACCGVEWLGD
jgi:hypothetical protein